MRKIKKHHIIILLTFLLLTFIILSFYFGKIDDIFTYISPNKEIETVIDDYFNQRCSIILSGDINAVKDQFDLTSKYGKWSYEHEIKRINYVKDWSFARGVTFVGCDTKLKIFSIKGGENAVKVYLSDITKLSYEYDNISSTYPNEFCYGTRHSINMVKKNDVWKITVDWYNDPLDDAIPENQMPAVNIIESVTETSAAFKYNREKAVEYADKYCGANFNIEDGYKYNKKYRNYSELGGDCANFASQILTDSQAGSMRMGGGWLYKKGEASAAWVNAGAFTHNMLYSGRARLITKGNYQKMVNHTKSLTPGDLIAYARKGDIVHISIVTAIDSAGVPLVNSHTNDRYHVPWDLGWNSDNITFWFLKING